LSEVNCEQSRNWLESGKMATGSGTKRALKSVQDSKCKEILLAVRSCLKTTTVYLQKHLPISNAVLRDLQCLHPLARKQSTGQATVAFVVKLSLKMSLILCIFSVLKKFFYSGRPANVCDILQCSA